MQPKGTVVTHTYIYIVIYIYIYSSIVGKILCLYVKGLVKTKEFSLRLRTDYYSTNGWTVTPHVHIACPDIIFFGVKENDVMGRQAGRQARQSRAGTI